MIISNIWRYVVTTKTIKKINDNSLFLLLLTHSSTQWRKSSNSSLHVSFVHGLLFTRSLHSCKRCLVFSHAWSSPHSSFNFVNGSYIIREKTIAFFFFDCFNIQYHQFLSFLFQYEPHYNDVCVHQHPWLPNQNFFL